MSHELPPDEIELATPPAPWPLAKLVAVALGAPLVAFTTGSACIALFPGSRALGFALGLHLMVPLWVALVCLLPLMRSGRAALAACTAVVSLTGLCLLLGATP